MKLKDSYHPYAMITILCWSLSYVLTRLTLQSFSAFSLGFLRYIVATAVLVVIAFFVKLKPPRKADLPWFLVAGATGFFLYMVFFNIGQGTVTATTGSVVIATVPLITALLARLVYREKLRRYQWAAIVLEFVGVLVLTLMNGVFSINVGLLWLFLAAFVLSVYNLLQRKLTKTYSALTTSAFSIFCGTVMLAVFLPASVRELPQASALHIFYMVLMGVFSSAIAYIAWSEAFAKAKNTSQVSNYMFFTPFITGVLGFVIAGEVPDRATLAGGAIIILGVFLFNFGGRLFDGVGRMKKIH